MKRALARRSGARAFELDLDTGYASFLAAEGKPFDPEGARQAVQEAGFELLSLELEVRGVLERRRDPDGAARAALRVPETGQAFWLVEGGSEEERKGLARISEWLDEASPAVVVTGAVHPHPGTLPGLTVRRFRRAMLEPVHDEEAR